CTRRCANLPPCIRASSTRHLFDRHVPAPPQGDSSARPSHRSAKRICQRCHRSIRRCLGGRICRRRRTVLHQRPHTRGAICFTPHHDLCLVAIRIPRLPAPEAGEGGEGVGNGKERGRESVSVSVRVREE